MIKPRLPEVKQFTGLANRDLSNFRTVINQVADVSNIDTPIDEGASAGNRLLNAGAEIADNILRENQEARITEGISSAQLELGALQSEYETQFAHDPAAGLEKYKQDREKIFKQYGDKISPIYKRQWNDSVRQITTRNDATNQAWMLKQTKINTTNSINKSILNNLQTAQIDGQAFGKSEDKEIEAFVNFASGAQELEKFAVTNLGQQKADELFENYQGDYMKSFLSGVAQTNPAKAYGLMKTEMVRDSFSNLDQYDKMLNSLEIRNNRLEAGQRKDAKLAKVQASDGFREKVGVASYAEMQQYFDKNDIKPTIRAFYEEMSGYANSKAAVKGDEKIDLKRKFQIILSDTIKKEDITESDVEALQEAIYSGMRKKVLTESEGFSYIDQILTPVVEGKRQEIAQFKAGEYNPFQENLGLDTLDAEIDAITGESAMSARSIGADDRLSFQKTKNQMYDYYLEQLNAEAEKRGTNIAGLSSLPFKEEKEVYTNALTYAKNNVMRSIYPELSTTKDEDMPATRLNAVTQQINFDANVGEMTKEELDALEAQLDGALK